MATFEAAGDFEDQIREAVSDQMETIVEQVRDTAEAFVEFPGERSKPVESRRCRTRRGGCRSATSV